VLGSVWTLVPWERLVLRHVLNLFRDRICYYLYEMFYSIYLLLSIEHLNMNFCTTVCVLWSFEVGYLAACVQNTVCYCGIKVIKMRSNSVAVVGWRGLFLPVIGWERRIIVLVDCFMCMIVLVLRIAYGQVVLLRTVLNFVAWQLEKASKCSVVVYTLSLVIWITST
jgi:hypothetical protein